MIKGWAVEVQPLPVPEDGDLENRREAVVGVDRYFVDEGFEEGLLGDVVAVVEDLADASADLGKCGWLRYHVWLFEFCFELGLAGA